MLRIGLDTEPMQGEPTGIGRYAAGLLAALRDAAPHDEHVELRPERAAPMRTDRRLRWQQWGLPRSAVRAGVDVLHVTGFDAPVRSGVPVVLTVHDLVGVLRPRDHPLASRAYWGRWVPLTIGRADAVIAISEATAREVVEICHRPPEVVTVVHPGTASHFRPVPRTDVVRTLRRHAVPEPYVLFVGASEPRKGLDILLDVMAMLSPRMPHHLVVVGPTTRPLPPVPPPLSPRSVHQLGYVADTELPALYTGADVVVLPSHHEGFGFPLVEALACGTPVVCSDVAALREVAGGAALHAAAGDRRAFAAAVAAVLEDPALAAELRRRGLNRAGWFDWHRAALDTTEVYAGAVDRHRRRARVR